MATNQVNMRLEEDLLKRLDQAVHRFGKSRATIAIEVLDLYLPLWEEWQRRNQEALNEQIEGALGKASAQEQRSL